MKLIRRPYILFLILLFSPYLFKGVGIFRDIRLDHIVLLFMGFKLLLSRKIFRSVEFEPFGLLFLVFLYSTFISSIAGVFSPSTRLFINIMEWYGRGLIIILFLKSYNVSFDKDEVMCLFRAVIFSSLLVNLIGLCQVFSPFDQIVNPFLTRFYSGSSVGGRFYVDVVLKQGRAISILAQTSTMGFYALLVFSLLLFLGPNSLKIQLPIYYILLLQSIIGGYMPRSKAFILGMPMMLLIYSFRMNINRVFKVGFVSLSVCFIIYIGFNYLNMQDYSSYAESSIHMLVSPEKIYTATIEPRFGEGRALDQTMDIIKHNWIIGVGVVGGIRLVDSQWVPLLVFGGILGLMSYIWYIYRVVQPVFKRKRILQNNAIWGRQVFLFYTSLLFIYTIFGIGSPTFIIDKTGDFFWILTAVLSKLTDDATSQSSIIGAQIRQ